MASTINWVAPLVMRVRDRVAVLALSMIAAISVMRVFLKFSRIRSNTTTVSFTE